MLNYEYTPLPKINAVLSAIRGESEKMIFMDSDDCPKTKKEAFDLQEPLREFYLQMELVKNALELFEDSYFVHSHEYLKSNELEQAYFIERYKKMHMQLDTVILLFEECYEYIALLCGKETLYNKYLQETVESGRKIKDFLLND